MTAKVFHWTINTRHDCLRLGMVGTPEEPTVPGGFTTIGGDEIWIGLDILYIGAVIVEANVGIPAVDQFLRDLVGAVDHELAHTLNSGVDSRKRRETLANKFSEAGREVRGEPTAEQILRTMDERLARRIEEAQRTLEFDSTGSLELPNFFDDEDDD